MIIITLKDLLYIVPDLINLFLSGFIFMFTYSWLNNKKIDVSILTLWSLFISFLVKSFCTILHSLIFQNILFDDALKVIIFSIIGLTLSIFCTYLKNTKVFMKLLYKINHKSINDDIFDDIIDYNKKTMMIIYLKSSKVYYIGQFSFREENGINSWISLVNYSRVDVDTNEVLFNPDEGGLPSSIAINLSNIQSVEIIYEKDSELGKILIGKDYKKDNINKENGI